MCAARLLPALGFRLSQCLSKRSPRRNTVTAQVRRFARQLAQQSRATPQQRVTAFLKLVPPVNTRNQHQTNDNVLTRAHTFHVLSQQSYTQSCASSASRVAKQPLNVHNNSLGTLQDCCWRRRRRRRQQRATKLNRKSSMCVLCCRQRNWLLFIAKRKCPCTAAYYCVLCVDVCLYYCCLDGCFTRTGAHTQQVHWN